MADTAHRKIDLQSPADLQHITAAATAFAHSRIDAHLRSTDAGGEGDDAATRQRVEELVREYVEKTLEGVRQNIKVNGMEGAEMEQMLQAAEGEETEPFDHKLARKIQAVSSEVEQLVLQVANLRREVPGPAAAEYTRVMKQREEEYLKEMQEEEERELAKAFGIEVKPQGLDGMEDMRRSWEAGTRRLVEVKDGIGAAVGKGEKAREAVRYLDET